MSNATTIDSRLRRFRNQYHQQLDLDALDYPPATVLLEPNVQKDIFHYFFDPEKSSLHPPLAYRRRVLKDLLSRIENAIVDPDQDEISDDLMNHMAELATRKELSAFEDAQSRSPAIYTCALEHATGDEGTIVVKESRNLLSAGGTTGMRTWDAALHLGTYLLSRGRGMIEGKRVLELGAGTGFLSLLCAGPLGAEKVVSTDGAADVVSLIETNIESNQDARPHLQSLLCADVLEWGSERSIQVHNRYFSNTAPCDIILAADVTYSVEGLDALIASFKAIFELNKSLQILLTARLRNQNTFESFKEHCVASGLKVKEVQFSCLSESRQGGLFHSHEPSIIIVEVTQAGAG